MTRPVDAPYRFTYDIIDIDGEKFCVYRLGGEGKKMVENALCKQQFNEARWNLEQDIKNLKSMLNVLTDIIGGPSAMVEYFKAHVLVQLKDTSCRTGDLVSKPYTDFKYLALEELLKEDKVVHTRNGWWKLARL